MDFYGLAGVHLKNSNYGLGYTDANFIRVEQIAMVRGWLARLKHIPLKSIISRSLRNAFYGDLATASQPR